jgi:hypothetical protein
VLTIRNATPSDIPAILNVESSWGESSRAGADKFLSRMDKFPSGFFLACTGPAADDVVATITSAPLGYQPDTLDCFKSWDAVTHKGYLSPPDLDQCNALYIVSGVIASSYRGQNIFAPMVLQEVALAQRMGLRYVLAGAVLPGYLKYCQQKGACDASDYCFKRRGQHLLDPLLAMYESIGFSVPDARHVIPDYYPDEASRNFGALVVRDLAKQPLINL